jgi:hypothetical protein
MSEPMYWSVPLHRSDPDSTKSTVKWERAEKRERTAEEERTVMREKRIELGE